MIEKPAYGQPVQPAFDHLTVVYSREAVERGYWPTDESARLAGQHRGGRIHILKTIWPYFAHVRSGHKTFEIRRNDRDFQPGDLLILAEWDDGFTGQDTVREVTYVMRDGEDFGVKPGFVVLGMVRRDG
jgi:hypothetical protein